MTDFSSPANVLELFRTLDASSSMRRAVSTNSINSLLERIRLRVNRGTTSREPTTEKEALIFEEVETLLQLTLEKANTL